MWAQALVGAVPGRTGCWLRNRLMPYRHGAEVTVWNRVHLERPSRLVLGSRVSINRGSLLHAGGGIRIGSDVLIGPNVTIYSQNHRYQGVGPVGGQGYNSAAVVIEDLVWLAASVIVLPGVTVGRGSVVAAGSVVTKDVPPGVLVAGNPARAIRTLDRPVGE